MSRKQPTEPPHHRRTAAQELVVPGLVLGGAVIVALLVLMFGDNLTGGDSAGAPAGNSISNAQMQAFRNEYDALGVAIGPEDAPVTIREFADYQCPACGAFAATAQKIREAYVEAGQVRFIFFDFPLPMHQHARTAAVAARCAARQDAFWTFHDKLFANQQGWSSEANPAGGSFLDMAVESGIRLAPFKQCMEQGATGQMVSRNAEIARKIGISSTPTVLIGQQVFAGVTPYAKIKQAIEARLPADSAQ